MIEKTKDAFVPFECPYCGTMVRSGDVHAQTIEKKNIREQTTIYVTCVLHRTLIVKIEKEQQ